MEIVIITLICSLILVLTLLGHWLDSKYNLQVVSWLNGEVNSPYKPTKCSEPRVDELKTRIENLEKIVTDTSWELNQKLNKL